MKKNFIFTLFFFVFWAGYTNAQNLEQRIRQHIIVSNALPLEGVKFGGYLMFKQGMDNDLCKNRDPNALYFVDHEGGRVNRLKSQLPAANKFTEKTSKNYYSQWGEDAKKLKSKCFDVILGPTIDTNFGDRSYSDNLQINLNVANKVATIIENHKLLPTFKHFPGHFKGCKEVMVKKEINVCPQGMMEIADIWKPFVNNSVPAIVISNYIYSGYSKLPAVVDYGYYRFLRKDLNYSGVIITDALWEMSVPLTEKVIWEIFKYADLVMILDPREAEKFVPSLAKRLNSEPGAMEMFEDKEQRVAKMMAVIKK